MLTLSVQRINFVEKMGTGFERIREICKKGNPAFPEIEFNENYFYVTFRQSKEYLKLAREVKLKGVTAKVKEKAIEKVIEKVGERVIENQKRILEKIAKDKYITAKRLSEGIGISEDSREYK